MSLQRLPNELRFLIIEGLSQSDLTSLILTCHHFADFQTALIKRDIKTKTYNSLAWACYFGDAKLARTCLSLGALADAAFCNDQPPEDWCQPGSHPRLSDAYYIDKDYNHFRFPVFPNIKLYGQELIAQACSALALATRQNHIEVMKVLLEFGASTLDQHYGSDRRIALNGQEDLFIFPHHSVISQVSSVLATKILLGAGAAEHINRLDKTAFTPLEMILYRFDRLKFTYRSEVPETEAFAIIQLLLRNGASTSRVEHTGRMPYRGRAGRLISGPLLAAVALGSTRIFGLILEEHPSDTANRAGEYSQALRMALTGNLPTLAKRSPDTGFCSQILLEMMRAGLSPRERKLSGKRLISHAISAANVVAIETLFKTETDSSLMSPQYLSLLSEAVLLSSTSGKAAERLTCVERIIKLGADVNQPSFCAEGFRPLLLAASDNIPADVFQHLLDQGAERSGFCRLLPDLPYVSVLQCLFNGYPLMGNDEEDFLFKGYRLSNLRFSVSESQSRTWSIGERRRDKFNAFVASGADESLFHTEDGTHILLWAVRTLRGSDLLLAVALLLPYYQSTQLEDTPLLALFCEARREEYLAFGTLPQVINVVQKLIAHGIPVDRKLRGETVLHRVCNLGSGLKSIELWTRISKTPRDKRYDYCTGFMNHVFGLTGSICSRLHVSFDIMNRVKTPYEDHRSRHIAKIIKLLVNNGADLQDPDSNGVRPIDLIKADGRLHHRLIISGVISKSTGR